MGFVRPIPERNPEGDRMAALCYLVMTPLVLGLIALGDIFNLIPETPIPEIRSTDRGIEFTMYHPDKLGFKSDTYVDQNSDGRLDYRLDDNENQIFVNGGMSQYYYSEKLTEWKQEKSD
jgi:hypothetical protein